MSDVRDRLSRVEDRPLQIPGRHRLVRDSTLGGPDVAVDARMILSREDLESMLEVARASLTGRVVLKRPGIRVRLFEDPAGHRYEIWTIVAAEAEAERHPMLGLDGSARFRIR